MGAIKLPKFRKHPDGEWPGVINISAVSGGYGYPDVIGSRGEPGGHLEDTVEVAESIGAEVTGDGYRLRAELKAGDVLTRRESRSGKGYLVLLVSIACRGVVGFQRKLGHLEGSRRRDTEAEGHHSLFAAADTANGERVVSRRG